jgi:hypothetical protein
MGIGFTSINAEIVEQNFVGNAGKNAAKYVHLVAQKSGKKLEKCIDNLTILRLAINYTFLHPKKMGVGHNVVENPRGVKYL